METEIIIIFMLLLLGTVLPNAENYHYGIRQFVSSANPDLKVLSFDEEYDFNLPPPVVSGPVVVNVSLDFKGIWQVNELTELVTAEIYLCTYWMDPRLRLSSSLSDNEEYLALNPRLARHLWVPDVYLDRIKEVRQPDLSVAPAASLRIYKDSLLSYSSRFNVDLSCPVNLIGRHSSCIFKLTSFGYTDRQLRLLWVHGRNDTAVNLPRFEVLVSQYYSEPEGHLVVELSLTRRLNGELARTFAPSVLILVAFWTTPQNVRPMAAFATLLTLTVLFAARTDLHGNDFTQLDVWSLACIAVIVLDMGLQSLLQFGGESRKWTIRLTTPIIFLFFNVGYWYSYFKGK